MAVPILSRFYSSQKNMAEAKKGVKHYKIYSVELLLVNSNFIMKDPKIVC